MNSPQNNISKTKPTHRRVSSRLERVAADSVSFLPDGGKVAVGAVIVGILAGIATSMLKRMINWTYDLLTIPLNPHSLNWHLLIYPVVGTLLALAFQRRVKQNLAYGTMRLKQRLADNDYFFKKSLMWNPMIGCWLTVGFGGSAGAEGPGAYSGGAIGSCIGRWFGLTPDAVRILVGCGAGAGIAGIFKAPIGGALFTLEVLKMPMNTLAVMCLIVSCLCSFATSYMINDFTWDVNFTALVPFEAHHLLWYGLLGVFCGIYSIYYNHSRNFMAKKVNEISNVWIKCIVSGLGLSVVIFFLPALFGEGYSVMKQMINDIDNALFLYSPFYPEMGKKCWTIGIFAAILLVKGMAVAATNNGGGVAGEFAPTLFAGSLAGYLFATLMNLIFDAGLPEGTFALIGMAGVMTGTVGAPLMSIFISTECSASYGFLLGFMLTAGISFIVVTSYASLTSHRNAAPIHLH